MRPSPMVLYWWQCSDLQQKLLIDCIMQIGWVNSWFEQCGVDPWWCYSKFLNFYVPPWNTYTVWVEETCANACRNHHAMLYCTASDIRPFKHSFEVHLVCVMQFSLLEFWWMWLNCLTSSCDLVMCLQNWPLFGFLDSVMLCDVKNSVMFYQRAT